MPAMKRAFALICVLSLGSAWAQIEYRLEPIPSAQSIQVSLTLTAGAFQEFRIPAWCPGFYFLQSYERKISDVRASDGEGARLAVEVSGPRAWTVQNPNQGRLTLSYRILGDDGGLGFFGVCVRRNTTFVNGPAAFMYPVGRLLEECKLTLRLPDGWDSATGLQLQSDGSLSAAGYDEFIDCPIELGKFIRRTFHVEGIPFEAVFSSEDQSYAPDLDSVAATLKMVSVPAVRMFGGAAFKRYLFIVHLAVGNFGGGLEHRNSTVLAVRNSKTMELDTLAAHELFHAWNVKQIRPAVLGPFDYTQEVRTANLWFAEGVTDYYAHMLVYRSGKRDREWLLSALGSQIGDLQSGQIRKRKTLEDVSREAWENGGFGVGDLSYYTKGLVAGLVFDAAIRSQTSGTRSLDDVLRLLFERHRLPRLGFPEDGLLAAINEVAGADLSGLYRIVVRSTDEVPYEGLRAIGLRLNLPRGLEVDDSAGPEAKKLRSGWLERTAR